MDIKNALGLLHFWYGRAISYSALVSMLISLSVFAVVVGFKWWHVLVIPAMILIVWIDVKLIFPSEADYGARKVQMYIDIENGVKELNKKIDKLLERINGSSDTGKR